jgi:hypothetical protein
MKTDTEEGSRLASEIAKRPSRTSHLPKEVLRAALAYARRRSSAGASQVTIARELGVSSVTVARWVSGGNAAGGRQGKPAKKSTKRMRPVRVIDSDRSPATTTIAATTRDGLRIEGLTVQNLIVLLRGLG